MLASFSAFLICTEREIEPHQLVLKGSHWYLHGYCYIRNDFRLFRISRMSKLKILEETFVLREAQKPVLDFTEILETMQTRITIRIHKSIMDRVLDYCSYDDFLPDGDEHYIVDFPFVENDYYYDVLLSFGNKCECLNPMHVREKMRSKICEIITIYEK